jgi:UPF0755 protein
MSRRVKIIGLLLAGGLLILGVILLPKINLLRQSRMVVIHTGSPVTFVIDSPMQPEELAKLLIEKKIIDNASAFVAVANYKGLTKESIALGKYRIEQGMQYRTILNGVTLNSAGNGNAELEVDVTFTNCRDIYQMAGKVTNAILLDSVTLVDYLINSDVRKKFNVSLEELPSLFLPNTYKMYYDTDAPKFIEILTGEYTKFWNNQRLSKISEIGLKSKSEVVTLASIVYSEQSRKKEEWPLIAGLYLNRIRKGIKLQSDPTFKFCWGDKLEGVQRLLHVHRDIACNYNTYQIMGLPPGPICIPPAEVIDAVLNRQKSKYIFMMAKADYSGLHDFSEEYAVHQRYAKIYQKWLANELKK